MRRSRITVIGVAVVIGGGFAAAAYVVSQQLLLLLPLVLGGWFLWYMPMWRRRVRKQARNLPNWQLRPE